MKLKLRIVTFLALLIGTVSLATLFYYYTIEKDFTQGYKQVIARFDQIHNSQERISYGVLQSTFFAYYNQDGIAYDRKKLEQDIAKLLETNLLKQSFYAAVHNAADSLQSDIATYIAQVERHLMINAAIKNSNVFLATYDAKSLDLFASDAPAVKKIHSVIDNITKAKKMLDDSYVSNVNKDIEKLKSDHYTKEQKQFIDNLLIHAQFIVSRYPKYLEVFYTIINTPLRQRIQHAKESFVQHAQQDMAYINNVASSLFILIFFAIIAIMTLLWMLQNENKILKNLQKKLRYSLEHDSLTLLKNRHSYETYIDKLDQSKLLLVNISKFKSFNDFYGTDTGDGILKHVAHMLENTLTGEDAVCFRVGGDEFAIVFNRKEIEYIQKVASRIGHMFTGARLEINKIALQIAVNMAISEHSPLIETADMAMKYLKANPTNNLLVYSPDLNVKEQIQSNIEMTQTLRSALLDDRIIPYYQPIMDLQTREIVKYEALARLRTEDGKIITPYAFLSVAYDTPLYYQITRVMIKKSMEYFADKPYRFSVNLSMQDLEDDSIIELILAQLASQPELASRFDIELLESESLSNRDKVKSFIKEVKQFGCCIAIDDFGSGYSNFSYLTEFDIDIVKIDGSLIKEITTNEEHYKAVKSIMSLVSELGAESVAEFVQDEPSAQLLTKLGVTHAQGFYFGKPEQEIVSLS